MKTKSRQILWYHLNTQIGENTLNANQADELSLYLQDKVKELNLMDLYFAYYHDHFHVLFSMNGRHSPAEMEKKILGAISWFITALKGESLDLVKETALQTVSPVNIQQTVKYLESHIDHHLNKDLDKELEKTVTQWQKTEL